MKKVKTIFRIIVIKNNKEHIINTFKNVKNRNLYISYMNKKCKFYKYKVEEFNNTCYLDAVFKKDKNVS